MENKNKVSGKSKSKFNQFVGDASLSFGIALVAAAAVSFELSSQKYLWYLIFGVIFILIGSLYRIYEKSDTPSQKVERQTKIKEEKWSFELKLVVIGILLTVYWQLLPQLVQSPNIGGYDFKLILLDFGYSIAGVAWFTTLLIGTFTLAWPTNNYRRIFDLMFKFSNVYTIAVLAFVATVYIIFFVIIYL